MQQLSRGMKFDPVTSSADDTVESSWAPYVGPSAPRVGWSAALDLHHMHVWHLYLPEHMLYHPVALRMVGSGKYILDAQAHAGTPPQSKG